MRFTQLAVLFTACVLSAVLGAWANAVRDPIVAPFDWAAALEAVRTSEDASIARAAARSALDVSIDPVVLVEALDLLGLMGTNDDVSVVEGFALGRDRTLRPAAVRALGRIGTDDAAHVLMALADGAPADPQAVVALGRSRHPLALARLELWLSDPELDLAATEGFVQHGGLGAVNALALLLARPEGNESLPAARALARLSAAEPAAAPLLTEIVNGPRTLVRQAAVGALADARDPFVFDALVLDFQTAPVPLAVWAADRLGVHGDPRAVPVLLARALDGPAEVSAAAMRALGGMDTQGSTTALLDIASRAPQSIGSYAVEQLRTLEDTTTQERLLGLINQGPDLMDAVAAQVLSHPWPQTGAPEPVLALAKQLVADPRTGIGGAGNPLGFLLRYGGPDEIARVERLIELRWPGRADAVATLEPMPTPIAERLLHLLALDSDSNVRRAALEALLRRGDIGFVEETLLAQLDAGLPTFGPTETLLVQLGSDRAIKALLTRVQKGTLREAQAAVNAIASTGSPAQVESLLNMVDRLDQPEVQVTLLHALVFSDVDLQRVVDKASRIDVAGMDRVVVDGLGRLGTRAARERLAKMVRRGPPNTRRMAFQAAVRLGGTAAEDEVIRALDDPDLAGAALAALDEIGTVGATRTVEEVALGLRGGPDLRQSALYQLAYVEGVDHASILLAGARDGSPQVRETAIRALGSLGTSEAAASLGGILDDLRRSEEDKAIAALALRAVGGPEALDREHLIDRYDLSVDTGFWE